MKKQESIGERVRRIRLSKNPPMSQLELGERAELRQPTISALEKGRSISSGKIASIAKALEVDALWLETGRGTPDLAEGPKGLKQQAGNQPELRTIKLLPSAGSCGGAGPAQVKVSDLEKLWSPVIKTKQFFEARGLDPKSVVAVIADGDSMYPSIVHGDLCLFVAPPSAAFEGGHVYALGTPAGVRIKRVQVATTGDKATLTSVNEDKHRYPDEDITVEQLTKFKCLGRLLSREG